MLVHPSYFAWHTTFAHLLELLLLLLLVLGVVGRVDWRTFGVSVLILVLLGVQYTFMYGFEGPLRALHVVNALALFWLALQLGRGAWRLLYTPRAGGAAGASNKSFAHTAPGRAPLQQLPAAASPATSERRFRSGRWGVLPSFTGTGACLDNACIESFFATPKKELIYQTAFATREGARLAVFELSEGSYNC